MEEEKLETDEISKKIETYIRRQAVIKSKFPNVLEAPTSIQNEYFALNTLIDSLETTRRGVWGIAIASDGTQIDNFVLKKYEEALVKFSKSNKENEQHISHEEEEAFQFPTIDFDSLRKELEDMETTADYRALYDKLARLQQEPLPQEIKSRLYEFNIAMARKPLVEEKAAEVKEDKPVCVDESKYAKIFGKAKGKIQQVLANIKSIFRGKDKSENDIQK